MTFITHARTAEELRLEVLSDLNRRIGSLMRQREIFARNIADRAKFNARINELTDMLSYWSAVEILGAKTPKR